MAGLGTDQSPTPQVLPKAGREGSAPGPWICSSAALEAGLREGPEGRASSTMRRLARGQFPETKVSTGLWMPWGLSGKRHGCFCIK